MNWSLIIAQVVAAILKLADEAGDPVSPEQVMAASADAISANAARRTAARDANTAELERP